MFSFFFSSFFSFFGTKSKTNARIINILKCVPSSSTSDSRPGCERRIFISSETQRSKTDQQNEWKVRMRKQTSGKVRVMNTVCELIRSVEPITWRLLGNGVQIGHFAQAGLTAHVQSLRDTPTLWSYHLACHDLRVRLRSYQRRDRWVSCTELGVSSGKVGVSSCSHFVRLWGGLKSGEHGQHLLWRETVLRKLRVCVLGFGENIQNKWIHRNKPRFNFALETRNSTYIVCLNF